MDQRNSLWQPAAFDPVTRRWMSRASPDAVQVPPLDGTLVNEGPSLRWAAEDFGHVVHQRPRAVLRPGGIADVAATVAFATKCGLTVAARGAGHSTYGQAQIGILVEATLRLIPAAERARRYRLHYHDLPTFIADQRRLVIRGGFDFLQGQILPAEPGAWRYLLEAAAYYTPLEVPVDTVLLDGLG
jgi:FAD/FMN-containing dehydrogenase